jgi:hypothetical protein
MNRRHYAAIACVAISLAVAGAAIAQEAAAGIEVTEILLGSALENGVPTAPQTSFARTDGNVYCVIRLRNGTGAEGTIRAALEPAEGEPAERANAGLSLDIPARARYRTVARFTTNRAAGSYRCVVRAEDGHVLSHADFTITE